VRRRSEGPLNADGVPSWLPAYDPAAWADPTDRPPADWGFGSELWRRIRGHERWSAAGREWLEARDRRGEWYRLTRQEVVSR
jgi:hypothetical protein